MRSSAFAMTSAAVLALVGCRHAEPAPSPAGTTDPPAAWPPPPLQAQLRLRAVVPRARADAPRKPWWKRLLSFLAGVESDAERPELLERPFDAAVDGDGSYVVADPDAARVVRFARDGAYVADLTCPDYRWIAPMSVATGDGVFVADAGAPAVVRWTAAGCRVLRPPGLERPTGLALSAARIVVADPPSHNLVVLSLDGEILARWGTRGEGAGELHFPTDVAAAPDGTLYVVDALNFRIVHVSADGAFLGAFGERGDSGAALARPKGVWVEPRGRIYVSDAQRDVVLVFEGDGTLQYVVGASGPESGSFAHPAGIGGSGRDLVVADSINRRIQVFEILGEQR